MKFSTVRIYPNISKNDWKVRFEVIEGDSEDDGLGPNSLGFYHYPRRIGKKRAFKILRSHLVAMHEKDLAVLAESLRKLKSLKIPNE